MAVETVKAVTFTSLLGVLLVLALQKRDVFRCDSNANLMNVQQV